MRVRHDKLIRVVQGGEAGDRERDGVAGDVVGPRDGGENAIGVGLDNRQLPARVGAAVEDDDLGSIVMGYICDGERGDLVDRQYRRSVK